MSIAPVVRSVEVRTPPDKTFDLFTSRMGDRWPKGRTPAANPHIAIVIEKRAEGRWFERDADGLENEWGKVLVYEPPFKLVLGWQLNARFVHDPAILTEVEISFAAMPGGGTRVTLEHRNLERLGEDAPLVAERIGEGWPSRLKEFAAFAEAVAA
jgi:uncharacterized protein YndB with AHSA1/START domain